MAKFNTGQSFADGDQVTGAKLNNIVGLLDIYSGLIADQTAIAATVSTADLLLIADTDAGSSGAANKVTAQKLFSDVLTNGTFANVNLTENLTYGTATGNRTVSTSATITTGTIPNLTAGTTTSTAATITNGTITTGLIPTLTAGTTTGTAGIFTSGTVATLNSTTGTITNLSTTLAGDFTISQGTGTLGTTGATLGTYGGATSVPVLAIDAKGRVTTASTSAITTGFTGFRNRIINGDMRIDQRNAGASVTNALIGYTLDRWSANASQTSKFTIQQNAASVTPPTGFTNYLGITSSSSYTVGAGEEFDIRQLIEGYNAADLAWGTASAATVTLSFWVRSSLTGTFGASIANGAFDRSYPFTYTISSSNTWEKKTITIAGDTSGTWLTANNIGIYVFFGLGVGTTLSGTAGAWAGTGYISATGATSVVGTSGATFYITGVQLEAGSTATDFERRPIGTELALCQRYYIDFNDTYAGIVLSSGSATNFRYVLPLPTTMRAGPTVTLSADSGFTASSLGGSGNDKRINIEVSASARADFRPQVYVKAEAEL